MHVSVYIFYEKDAKLKNHIACSRTAHSTWSHTSNAIGIEMEIIIIINDNYYRFFETTR